MSEPRMIDARGPRFSAAVTAVVLAVTLLITPSVVGVVLLVGQALAFGAAALLGMRYQPYGWFFRTVVAPRLGPPTELEDERPPRFAQQVGLGFVLIALVALSFGNLTLVAQIAIGFALAASFLNAVFKFCLGCEIYLLFQRIRSRRSSRGQAALAEPVPAPEDEAAADEPTVAAEPQPAGTPEAEAAERP